MSDLSPEGWTRHPTPCVCGAIYTYGGHAGPGQYADADLDAVEAIRQASWDDARCREGECRESWRDAEEAGR